MKHPTRETRAWPASSRSVYRLTYPGLALPVILRGAPEVMDGLAKVVLGWSPSAHMTAGGKGPEMASVTREANGSFTLRSIFLEEPMRHLPAASAVCGILADLAQGYFEERRGFISLHCGAFLLKDRLIAVTGAARAGKSTLIARLTAEADIRVLCDNVLPVSAAGVAHGLGIAPRLRLPLPASANASFATHVARYMALSDERYGYITPPTMAPHGTSAPLSIMIVLARKAEGAAALHRLAPADTVHHLLLQNMANLQDRNVLAHVTSLAGKLMCFSLEYADLEDAVTLIRRAFGEGGAPRPALISTALPPAPPRTEAPLASADPAIRYRRCPQVMVRRVAGQLFLWHCEHHTSFHLNAIAAAVWRLLDVPETGAIIAAFLAEAFPDEPAARIAGDVSHLFAEMVAEQLIEPDTGASP